jgi:cyclophilin family peptidyl-prolyl cis-trans isomerase
MVYSIFDRLLRRRNIENQPRKTSPLLQPLENRRMLSGVTVTSATADNRGEVVLTLSGPVIAADVNKDSVQMYTAGHDKILDTADDTQVTLTGIHYNTTNNRITIVGNVAANTAYRVRLVATRIRDNTQTPIDGDFSGTFPSGNHKAGGNFEFQVKNDTSATPTAQFITTLGTMDVALFRGATKTTIATPKNVANFLNFANAGDYDNIFVTRSVPDFIEQMGSLGINSIDNVVETPHISGVLTGEPGNSNVAGTVAFALHSGPNTGDNDFFFNVADNTELNSTATGSGPFTVFGEVENARSFAVLTAMNNLNRVDLSDSTIGDLDADVSNVPVNANVPVTGETAQDGGFTSKTIQPINDFVVIERVSLLMLVRPL